MTFAGSGSEGAQGTLHQQGQSAGMGHHLTPRGYGTRYGTVDDPTSPLRERRPGKSRNSPKVIVSDNEDEANEGYAG